MPLAPQEIRTYFITTVTANRRRLFQVERNAEIFLEILQDQRNKNRLQLHAFVVMPDHAHFLLTPAQDVSLEKAMQYIKGGFSFRLKSKGDVWERSYDSRRITDSSDYAARVGYIHQNPIRARLATKSDRYAFSSANPKYASDPAPSHFV